MCGGRSIRSDIAFVEIANEPADIYEQGIILAEV